MVSPYDFRLAADIFPLLVFGDYSHKAHLNMSQQSFAVFLSYKHFASACNWTVILSYLSTESVTCSCCFRSGDHLCGSSDRVDFGLSLLHHCFTSSTEKTTVDQQTTRTFSPFLTSSFSDWALGWKLSAAPDASASSVSHAALLLRSLVWVWTPCNPTFPL